MSEQELREKRRYQDANHMLFSLENPFAAENLQELYRVDAIVALASEREARWAVPAVAAHQVWRR